MNLLTIAFYELKRILRNHRLVLIVISQPIVISIIVGLLIFQDPKDIKLGVINQNANKYSDELVQDLKSDKDLIISDEKEVSAKKIKDGKLRGFVLIDIRDGKPVTGEIKIYHDPAGRNIKYVVMEKLTDAINKISKEVAIDNVNQEIKDKMAVLPIQVVSALPKIEIQASKLDAITASSQDVTPFSLTNFDYFASAIMVLMIILVVINLSAISITHERASGTFERLFVTPYSKIDVILGKAIALFSIGIIVAILGTASLYFIFHVNIANLWLMGLINLLVGASAVTLGLLISSVTYAVVESAELAIYIFFVSVLTTGIFSPIEQANKYFTYAMKSVPFYYAVDASRRVNMVDAGFHNIATNIYVLIGTFVFFLILSIVLLRREAK